MSLRGLHPSAEWTIELPLSLGACHTSSTLLLLASFRPVLSAPFASSRVGASACALIGSQQLSLLQQLQVVSRRPPLSRATDIAFHRGLQRRLSEPSGAVCKMAAAGGAAAARAGGRVGVHMAGSGAATSGPGGDGGRLQVETQCKIVLLLAGRSMAGQVLKDLLENAPAASLLGRSPPG